nr:MAG TPA: hypothetical protein [Caudoviricetes sp.]
MYNLFSKIVLFVLPIIRIRTLYFLFILNFFRLCIFSIF